MAARKDAAAIHEAFCRAFNARDAEALAALYEPDAALVTGGETVRGRENIRKAYESMLPRCGRMTLETRSVVELEEGLAVLHGEWTVEAAAEGGREARGVSTEVARRQPEGHWLFVIDEPHTAQ